MIVKPNNKKEVILDNVKLKEEINKNDSIAIMLEQSDGTYKESNESIFPSNMMFNSEKSGCIDKEGNELVNSLTYSNGLITIETNKTIYCYVYFDRKENGNLTLSETSGEVGKGSTHTFTVTNNVSGGALSVISNDNNIATASVSGNTVTITGVSEGSTTITVTSAETSNYLSSSVTYNVTVNAMATILVENYGSEELAYFTIGETKYSSPTTISVPIGTIINFYISSDNPVYAAGYININGEQVVSTLDDPSSMPRSYSYTVAGNITISLSVDRKETGYGKFEVGNINITEVPEGHVLVNITGYSYGLGGYGSYVNINGTTYSNASAMFVPIGTVIQCIALQGKGVGGTVTVNGTVVAQPQTTGSNAVETVTYDYTVSGNIGITLAGGAAGPSGPNYGTIVITEQ